MKTKTAAIRHARANVSELYRFGDGWKFSTFDPACNAWREHGPDPYHLAQVYRSRALIGAAAAYLFGDNSEAVFDLSYDYESGPWVDHIPTT